MVLALLEAEGRMHRLAGFRHLPALQEALRETFREKALREESPPRARSQTDEYAAQMTSLGPNSFSSLFSFSMEFLWPVLLPGFAVAHTFYCMSVFQ